MEERRRITTVRQLKPLVDVSKPTKISLLAGSGQKKLVPLLRDWKEVSEILNAEGPARTAKEWSKVWNDQKCKVRAKLVNINVNKRGTGGGPNNAPTLTAIEEKIANILGRTVGPLPGVSQDQLVDIMVMNEDVMQDIAAENVVGEVEVAEEPINILPTIN
ncbi:unnamed protein product [Chilo suppressalis]|uniref:Regulatory protein zeste n=1 Tax=Chilo suppressalis TaxID=168631 RepID=A0ABN8B2C4_CHISP|nr:unnamed protein product [Chilo suppressalis]